MEPLAARIRPEKIDDVVGQEHLVEAGKPLRIAIEKKNIFSKSIRPATRTVDKSENLHFALYDPR